MYTIEDFINGNIAICCETTDDNDALFNICVEHCICWNSGDLVKDKRDWFYDDYSKYFVCYKDTGRIVRDRTKMGGVANVPLSKILYQSNNIGIVEIDKLIQF